MPHKKRSRMGLVTPAWLDALDQNPDSERCLYTIVFQALVSRRSAEARGALDYHRLAAAIRKADFTLQSIADGRARDDVAWEKAIAALRKYAQVKEAIDRIRRKERDQALGVVARSLSKPRSKRRRS